MLPERGVAQIRYESKAGPVTVTDGSFLELIGCVQMPALTRDQSCLGRCGHKLTAADPGSVRVGQASAVGHPHPTPHPPLWSADEVEEGVEGCFEGAGVALDLAEQEPTLEGGEATGRHSPDVKSLTEPDVDTATPLQGSPP